jgi:hypothetical protein
MRLPSLVGIALAALVAGAAALVHAEQGADEKPTSGAEVLYDLNALPDPVKAMLERIGNAAATGDIEKMRPVFESNELKPMVAAAYVDDPIAHWKKESADGTGRDVLAVMLNVMSSGFVLTGKGDQAMYVWPYFAETDITKLSPEQEVELYRLLPAQDAIAMKKAGKYSGYKLGIAPTGVWHYFIK